MTQEPIDCAEPVCRDGATADTFDIPGGYERVCTLPGRIRDGQVAGHYDNHAVFYCGEYRDDQRTGLWTFFTGDGVRSRQGVYNANDEVGVWTTWKMADQLYVAAEVHYREGVKHGLATTWHATGRKALEGQYANGMYDGEWRQWAADGKLLGAFTITNGTGTYRSWSDEGTLLVEGDYVDGRREGLWRWYRDSGELLRECEFDSDVALTCPVDNPPWE